MKKSLLLTAMAAVTLSAAAQGVDPVQYTAGNGYQLENIWLMSRGDGSNGVATADFDALPFDNMGKATYATLMGDYVYITCSQSYVEMINEETGEPFMGLDAYCHLVVLDAATGKYVKTIDLTLNGERYYGLIAANCIGHDDFGHLYISNYVQPTYDDETGVAKPVNFYTVNTETGEMTLQGACVLDEIDGPGHGARVDFTDVIGDLTGEQARCVVMACPNEIAAVYVWSREQGETEWKPGNHEDYAAVPMADTDPAEQAAWNYSPIVRMVRDEEFNGDFFYIDGHATRPALYDETGEMIEKLMVHGAGETADEGWADFIPEQQPNGALQFGLGADQFFAYPLHFGDDKQVGGHIALVKLDENESFENATPMWIMPQDGMGIKKGEGRFAHAIDVSPVYYDENGKAAINIFIYKDCNGCGLYRLAEEGFQAGAIDIEADVNADAPVQYFNLNGQAVDATNLTPGFYIRRQGTTATKVIR